MVSGAIEHLGEFSESSTGSGPSQRYGRDHRTPACPRGCRTRNRTSASQRLGPRPGRYTNPPGRVAGLSIPSCSPAVPAVESQTLVGSHTLPAAPLSPATWSSRDTISTMEKITRPAPCRLTPNVTGISPRDCHGVDSKPTRRTVADDPPPFDVTKTSRSVDKAVTVEGRTRRYETAEQRLGRARRGAAASARRPRPQPARCSARPRHPCCSTGRCRSGAARRGGCARTRRRPCGGPPPRATAVSRSLTYITARWTFHLT